jgi:quinol monooxygenase YgiN
MRVLNVPVLALAMLLTSGVAGAQDKEPEFITRLKKLAPKGAFTMIVHVQVKKGEEKTLLEAARPCVAATRKEKGCIAYDLQQDLDDPTKFIFYERWESIKALEDHLAAEHTKKLVGIAGKIAASEPQFTFYRMTVPLGKATAD